MGWRDIIIQCERFESASKKKHSDNQYQNRSKKRPQHQSYNNHNSSSYFRDPSRTPSKHTTYRGNKKSSNTFQKLSLNEKVKLDKNKACYVCKKPGHMAKDCFSKNKKISSAATEVTASAEEHETPSNEISSAA